MPIWIMGIAFPWIVGRAFARHEQLVAELEEHPAVSWLNRRCWPNVAGSRVTCTTSSGTGLLP